MLIMEGRSASAKPGGISVIGILRLSAWLLLAATVAILFTGFFMTRAPVLDYFTSKLMHTFIIPFVFIPFFYLHSMAGILFALCRKGYSNSKKVKALAFVLWSLLFVPFIFFYVTGIAPADATAVNRTMAPGTLLTMEELARHSSASNCWILVMGSVYDVAGYLNSHPTGSGTIIPYCGKDATTAFETKGGIGRDHNPRSYILLERYLLGSLGSAVSANVKDIAGVPFFDEEDD
jgi:cytochrome b involved in lipid metabolism